MGLTSKIKLSFRGLRERIDVCLAYKEMKRVWSMDASRITDYDLLSYYGAKSCIKNFQISAEKDTSRIAALKRQCSSVYDVDYSI